MIYVIDAFNLIYKFPELEEHMYRGQLEQAMRGLTDVLTRLRSEHGKVKRGKRLPELHVFFDGKRKAGDETRRLQLGGLQLYYSHDLSADHLIREFLKSVASPGEVTVVSSDKEVLDYARKHRCHRKTSDEFALWVDDFLGGGLLDDRPGRSELRKNRKRKDEDADKDVDVELGADEVAYWQEMFRKRD